MKRDDVYTLCKTFVPPTCEKIGVALIDPRFIMAICEQESVMPGNPTIYREDARRLEEGFFLKYTEPQNYEVVAETLFAISWGLPQLMGQSLLEMGYFEAPIDSIGVTAGLQMFCQSPEHQIEYAVRWFVRKLNIAKGDTTRALLIWNGGGDPDYPRKVLTRYESLKGLYK